MAFQAAGQPAIPADTKKKELAFDYKNPGSGYRPEGCPDKVAGCVSAGIDHDTAGFAVNAIRRRHEMGRERYPLSGRLTIAADGRFQCQPRPAVDDRVAKTCRHDGLDPYGAPLSARHAEMQQDRVFCHITQNWRGRPLTSRPAIVEPIAATTTKTGPMVRCELDANAYAKGIKVSDAGMASLNIKGEAFHPESNYTISPRPPKTST